MRLGFVLSIALSAAVSACSSTTSPSITPAASASAVHTTRINLTDEEISFVRRDVALAFADPTRPLFDPIAGATDSAGVRYACGTVFGKAEAGGNPSTLPYAGRFTTKTFLVLSKGGTASETRATEDFCSRLGILPSRR